jgi:two-component system, OmpR family, sensor histidine kinase ChvG
LTQSIRFTEPDTASQEGELPALALRWSGRLSLTQRILAVNILALALFAGSIFYLDGYRIRLIGERLKQTASEARLIATAMEPMTLSEQRAFIARVGQQTQIRIRIADTAGHMIADSWAKTGPNFKIINANEASWQKQMAGFLDEAVSFVADAGSSKEFAGFAPPQNWQPGQMGWSLAKDRTHMIWASTMIQAKAPLLLMIDNNARDIRRLVRAERSRLAYVMAVISGLSILLSLFLARTIAQPLQKLAEAALRVRLGREREVIVPRLPSRRDEIGLLARALSDMSQALRQRIDATEAFAADVAHELKNPLASLSSAVESLAQVKDPALQSKLQKIIGEDVRRLDRLITDIADLSRIDSQMARTHFERVDLGKLLGEILHQREARHPESAIKLAFARPKSGTTIVMGDPTRLARTIENIIDNAISFSPEKGVVSISAVRSTPSLVMLSVEDDGPGVDEKQSERIFQRFHSDRPGELAFGKHSGLGLSIARAIVEAHDGTIAVTSRPGAKSGARFVITMPAA